MAKRRVKRSSGAKASKAWAGFNQFQLIVIFSVFLVLAIFWLM